VKGGIVKEQCCKNCAYFQVGDKSKNEPDGECWAGPPAAQMLIQPNPLTMKPEIVKYTFFPEPNPKYTDVIGCRLWKARLN
jgi:hypothetical protein